MSLILGIMLSLGHTSWQSGVRIFAAGSTLVDGSAIADLSNKVKFYLGIISFMLVKVFSSIRPAISP